ncbi:MAG: metal ABC transporter permease [candidate division Zixibacteria bacterium]|nr:metal ABC transporter permease [candidate division Zixibacteria bacterium]MDD5425813.1 metal ABC transporter permease [candidate division Zixibacteria bacterium]
MTVLEFIDAVFNHTFMLYALLTGVLASIACGVVGTYVVARRITYIAGGIAHSVLGGMGLAYYLKVVQGLSWLQPLHGAVVAALASAVTIALASIYLKEREDTVIGAIWAIGMAVGIIFIAKTPGYSENLMSYLFGNILMVTRGDLWLIAALDAFVVIVGYLFHKQIAAVCFDEEFARVRGVRVQLFYLLLLCLTALTVVILTTVVGIVMVIAFLTLPVAVAGYFTRKLWQTMVLATLLSIFFMTFGLALSYSPDLPAGATIIILAGLTYLIVSVIKALRKI